VKLGLSLGGKTIWYDNKLLRRIFGPKMDEVTWYWRGLHNEELHDLYLTNII